MAYGSALAVLADPTRREVFERLRAGPRPVNVLAAGLPVSRPAVSQHLKVLKDAGLVEERSEGVRRIYSVRREGLTELREWLDSFWGDALEAFKLEAEKSHKASKREEVNERTVPPSRRCARPFASRRRSRTPSRSSPAD